MPVLAPPQNGAGGTRPPLPANPASLVDITNAKEYVDRLSSSKKAAHLNAATDVDIGAAETYKAAVIFSHSPGGNATPAWLANLTAMVQQIANDGAVLRQRTEEIANDMALLRQRSEETANDVAFLRQRSEEMPILLANNQAGTRGPLLNPTAMANGWAPLLAAPNPRTRDELLSFTTAQCIASATSLGLAALPAGTPVLERRRQIAVRIGVTIE